MSLDRCHRSLTGLIRLSRLMLKCVIYRSDAAKLQNIRTTKIILTLFCIDEMHGLRLLIFSTREERCVTILECSVYDELWVSI